MLWYAEALNESGQSSLALAPLNQARKRAKKVIYMSSTLTGFGTVPPRPFLPDVTFTDQADVRTAIQHERRVEFGFEFHRFFDVIRWGQDYATTR